MTNVPSHVRTCPCGAQSGFVLSPLQILATGRNGLYAQPLEACAHVPEGGVFSGPPQKEEILVAPLTLYVCEGCGASRFVADPEDVRAMLDAEQPGITRVIGPPATTYR